MLISEFRQCLARERDGNEEVEDCNHWLLRCPRHHLLKRVEKRLPNFASLPYDIQSAAIMNLACEDHEIAQFIYLMWTSRFG